MEQNFQVGDRIEWTQDGDFVNNGVKDRGEVVGVYSDLGQLKVKFEVSGYAQTCDAVNCRLEGLERFTKQDLRAFADTLPVTGGQRSKAKKLFDEFVVWMNTPKIPQEERDAVELLRSRGWTVEKD